MAGTSHYDEWIIKIVYPCLKSCRAFEGRLLFRCWRTASVNDVTDMHRKKQQQQKKKLDTCAACTVCVLLKANHDTNLEGRQVAAAVSVHSTNHRV